MNLKIKKNDFPEITIPNTQTMLKELNGQKILEGLKSFLEEITLAMLNIGMLNKSNEHFQIIYHQILLAKGEAKKVIDLDSDINSEFESYLNKMIVDVTDDKFDIDTNSTCKFLLYHYNLMINMFQKFYGVKIAHISLIVY